MFDLQFEELLGPGCVARAKIVPFAARALRWPPPPWNISALASASSASSKSSSASAASVAATASASIMSQFVVVAPSSGAKRAASSARAHASAAAADGSAWLRRYEAALRSAVWHFRSALTDKLPLGDRAFAAALRRIDKRQKRAAETEAKQRLARQNPAPAAALMPMAEQPSDCAGSDDDEVESMSWWETLWPIEDVSLNASSSSARSSAGVDASGPVAEPSVRQLRDLFETIRLDIDAFAFKTLNARMRY